MLEFCPEQNRLFCTTWASFSNEGCLYMTRHLISLFENFEINIKCICTYSYSPLKGMDKQHQNIFFHNGLMGIYKYVLIGLVFAKRCSHWQREHQIKYTGLEYNHCYSFGRILIIICSVVVAILDFSTNKMNCELMLTYDTPALRQTGSRNLTGQKTLPTIWGTYMKLVTKYQISAINSC